MKTIRLISAFFQALLPLIVFIFIGLVLLNKVPSPYNKILFFASVVTGIVISRSSFVMMARRGVIEVLSEGTGSADLDNLEQLEADGVFQYEAKDIAFDFQEKKLDFLGGTVRIWGDWEGRKLNVKHTIETIEFDEDTNVLTFKYEDGCLLKIKRPTLVFCSSSYLKIIKAKEVLWQTPGAFGGHNQFSYLNIGKTIITKSNTKWEPHEYDLGIGQNAVYLQG